MKSVCAVIPAAGVGRRFGAEIKKQFFQMKGSTVLKYTLTALKNGYDFKEYIIGAAEEDRGAVLTALDGLDIDNVKIVNGGERRCDTVYNALLHATCDYVAVHDSVRPFVSPDIIRTVVDAGIQYGGAICGLYSVDTVKQAQDGFVERTLDRNRIFLAHTPQVFHRETLVKAMETVINDGVEVSDEAGAYEYSGLKVKLCPSSIDNIKITRPDDMSRALALIEKYFIGK